MKLASDQANLLSYSVCGTILLHFRLQPLSYESSYFPDNLGSFDRLI